MHFAINKDCLCALIRRTLQKWGAPMLQCPCIKAHLLLEKPICVHLSSDEITPSSMEGMEPSAEVLDGHRNDNKKDCHHWRSWTYCHRAASVQFEDNYHCSSKRNTPTWCSRTTSPKGRGAECLIVPSVIWLFALSYLYADWLIEDM